MGLFESMTLRNFEDAIYIGHTSLAAASHGGIANSNLTAVQGQLSVNNLHLGKLTTDIATDGNKKLYFDTCFFEIPDVRRGGEKRGGEILS